MKGRLGEPALPAVDGALAVEEPLAEELLGDVAAAGFDKLPVVSDQDVPNMIGMGNQNRVLRTQPELGHIAASALGVL